MNPTYTIPAWINILAALLTPIIAVIAVCIAYRQGKTNSLQLKYELFTRRLEIYDSIASFLALIVQDRNISKESLEKFLRETRRVRFLFDVEIKNDVDKIYKTAVALHGLHSGNAKGQELYMEGDKQSQYLHWFEDELNKLEDRFLKYMQLSH